MLTLRFLLKTDALRIQLHERQSIYNGINSFEFCEELHTNNELGILEKTPSVTYSILSIFYCLVCYIRSSEFNDKTEKKVKMFHIYLKFIIKFVLSHKLYHRMQLKSLEKFSTWPLTP